MEWYKLSQLQPEQNRINTIVRVINRRIVIEKGREDGTSLRICESIVGDETGTFVLLCSSNSQTDLIIPDNLLVLSNAFVDVFDGYMRLSVDRWGSIQIPSLELFDSLNLSNFPSNFPPS